MKWLKIGMVLMAAAFACARPASAEGPLAVSVFDVKQEKVVQAMPLEPTLQRSVLALLQSGPTVYGGLSVNPRSGLIVRIDFPAPLRIPHPFYKDRIREVYLFLEPDTAPRALLFSEHGKTTVAILHGDSRKFTAQNHLGR
jgi:hypothetical protein